jgi:hypothetical protein
MLLLLLLLLQATPIPSRTARHPLRDGRQHHLVVAAATA